MGRVLTRPPFFRTHVCRPQGKLRTELVSPTNARSVLEDVSAGGMAGFLTVLAGYPLFMEISALTDVRVACLPKTTFDKLVDYFPYVWFSLAKRWSAKLSPLVRQVDYALDWVHMDAGQVLSRPGDACTAIHLVLNGRLRMIGKPGEGKKLPETYAAAKKRGRREACARAGLARAGLVSKGWRAGWRKPGCARMRAGVVGRLPWLPRPASLNRLPLTPS